MINTVFQGLFYFTLFIFLMLVRYVFFAGSLRGDIAKLKQKLTGAVKQVKERPLEIVKDLLAGAMLLIATAIFLLI